MSNYTQIDNLILMTYASIDSIKRMWNMDALCLKEMEALSLLIVQTPIGCTHSDAVIKGLYEDLHRAADDRKNYLQSLATFN